MSKKHYPSHSKENGVAKVPFIMQLEALECGAASLTMILAYYGKWVPLEKVRLDCGVSRDGSSAKNIVIAAKNYGLNVKAYTCETDVFRRNATFPCIVHWEFCHFIVVNGFKGNKVYVNDPAKGFRKMSIEEFDKGFTGVCLLFEPSENFVKSGKPKKLSTFIWKKLKGTGIAFIFTAIVAVLISLFNLISPAFSRVFLDNLLTENNPDWVLPFFIILLVFNIAQIVISGIRDAFDYKIENKIAAIGNLLFMNKALNLPLEFYSQRMVGDIQNRKDANSTISYVLIKTFAPLLLQLGLMVLYAVAMIRISWILTIVGLLSFGINALVSNIISKKRTDISRIALRETAKLNSTTVSGISMIDTIKASGAEDGYFGKWSGHQASLYDEKTKANRTSIYLGIIPLFVSLIADEIILLLGVYLTMQGQFTIGMIMQFQGLLTLFMAPAQTLIDADETFQEMKNDMERIDDVMEYPLSNYLNNEPLKQDRTYEKIMGDIEIKNLSFGYSPLAAPIVKDFNLTIKFKESVAIVGGSGCGKSTMSKLISGLYKPWTGNIIFDGRDISEIERSVLTSSLAVVDQDVILFDDTIANNIKMFDTSIQDMEMILAARDAQIHDDIIARPEGYQHVLAENGKDFSGGQKQRLEIARVLAQDPTFIILDEATSALDAKTEYDVVRSIRDRGITTIVIAHRLSTVRSCDRIVVMDKGVIVDIGTHDELMERCDIYRTLVVSD